MRSTASLISAFLIGGLLVQGTPVLADVNNQAPWHAHYYTENVEYRMAAPGDSLQLIVQFTNGGTQSWVKGEATEARLGTGWTFGDPTNPSGNQNDFNGGWSSGWLGPSRIASQVEARVGQGTNASFTYTATIPGGAKGGRHPIKGQPLIENVTWLENYGYYQGFDVLTPNLPCTTPPTPYACVQGTAAAGTCIAAGVPGCSWRADAKNFWSTMTLTDGSSAPGQPYAGSGTQWDFFFGSAKKSIQLQGGQTYTLNYP